MNTLNTYCRENRRCCYIPVTNKADPSMNNVILSNKRVLMIATMLSAMMLTASSMPSLVPTTAFAQQDLKSDTNALVGAVLTRHLNPNSENEGQSAPEDDAAATDEQEEERAGEAAAATADEGQSAPEDDAAATSVDPLASETNRDPESEEEMSSVDEDDLVTVDPITQTSVDTDVNVDVDTAVVLHEEDCEKANDEVTQANGQVSDQQAGGEGRVGDNSIYVSPKLQLAEQIALNANADVDVVLVDGCNPNDEVTQANGQVSDQGISSDLESSPTGTAIIPADQRADKFAENIGVNRDFILPVL
jgi:hypothetical protein